jgi:Dolichyl-phosphate-mannose-protein mannosyltransferase
VDRHPPTLREGGIVALLTLVLVGQLGLGLRRDGITVDELLYLASGYRHLTALDFRPCPSHPPLAKMLAAAGLLGLPLKVPDLTPGPGEWSWAFQFIHAENDATTLIHRGRVVPCLLTVLLVLLLWSWAREAGGPVAGVAAVALAAFHPSLLAHGHLATTDLPGTLGLFAMSWAFWRWTRRPTMPWALAVACLLGLTVNARLTGWLGAPILATLAGLHALGLPAGSRRRFLRQALVLGAVGLVVVPAVIWSVHGFRYAPWPGASVAEAPGPGLGLAGDLIRGLEAHRVLPEAYLEGARFQLEHNMIGHPAFLLGARSNTGWVLYYLVAFVVKSTPGFLVALAISTWVLTRRRGWGPASVATHAATTAALVFVTASLGHIQIGERYILPVHPYLMLLMAVTAPALVALKRGRVVAAGVLALHAGPSLLAAPGGHLSYFNLLAGGRAGGHRVLLDSNLDWGQDLPRLAEWMRAQGVKTVQLGYHGSDDPHRVGIDAETLPGLNLFAGRPPRVPFSGTVAVSPNLLMGLFSGGGYDPYAELRQRPPDDRAGVFFIYRLPEPRTAPGPSQGPS